MQPARFRQEAILLVEINNAKVHESGEERGLLSRTAAGNRAYQPPRFKKSIKLFDMQNFHWQKMLGRFLL